MQSLSSLAQVGLTPASMLISPMMSLAQSANAGTAGLAVRRRPLGADARSWWVTPLPAIKGLGGAGAGLGAAASAGLGKANLVGAMSVPPTWQGRCRKGWASSALTGLGGMTSPAAMAQAAGRYRRHADDADADGRGGAGGGMPAGMMGRGGANPQVVQARPSVIPRTGVG